MGLYQVLALFWLTGSIKHHLGRAALYSRVVFMSGLALELQVY